MKKLSTHHMFFLSPFPPSFFLPFLANSLYFFPFIFRLSIQHFSESLFIPFSALSSRLPFSFPSFQQYILILSLFAVAFFFAFLFSFSSPLCLFLHSLTYVLRSFYLPSKTFSIIISYSLCVFSPHHDLPSYNPFFPIPPLFLLRLSPHIFIYFFLSCSLCFHLSFRPSVPLFLFSSLCFHPFPHSLYLCLQLELFSFPTKHVLACQTHAMSRACTFYLVTT